MNHVTPQPHAPESEDHPVHGSPPYGEDYISDAERDHGTGDRKARLLVAFGVADGEDLEAMEEVRHHGFMSWKLIFLSGFFFGAGAGALVWFFKQLIESL